MKFAVQMYSVRDQIHNGDDMLAILPKIKALGYDGVEFAGFFGLDAPTLKAGLDAAGLVCVGAHIGRDDFRPENLEKTLDYMQTLGAKCVGVGGAPFDTETELRETIEVLGHADEVAKTRGMRVYYHNHTREFAPPYFAEEPGTVFDRMKAHMAMQLDAYWSFVAGQDNATLIRENRDHLVHIHIKDGVGGTPTALGEGENDLMAIVDAAKDIGLPWLILENDDPVPDGLSDIGRSALWLKQNA
ncbi:MAG: sugar phosphate isomerase/epimerase [Clostridia bacterium]|nr:sugar phosphate isomerase/epimerase [Clostridia bacterium]